MRYRCYARQWLKTSTCAGVRKTTYSVSACRGRVVCAPRLMNKERYEENRYPGPQAWSIACKSAAPATGLRSTASTPARAMRGSNFPSFDVTMIAGA